MQSYVFLLDVVDFAQFFSPHVLHLLRLQAPYLNLLRHLGLLEALRQVTGLLRVPIHRARGLAVTVARNHETLPAEHPEEEVQGRGGDVVLAAQFHGAVHHPLNVNEAAAHEGAVVRAEEALGADGGRNILQLRGVVELTAAEADRRAAEERGLSAAQHDDDFCGERRRGIGSRCVKLQEG